jgi:hypothetical protein
MTDEGGRKAVERIWNGSTWGEESTVVNSYVESISYAQLTDGELRMAYTLHSNDNLCERRLQRYAQLGAGIIERGAVAATGNNTTAEYIKYSDGTMIVHGVTDALTNATLYAITYPATFIAAPTLITNPNVDSTSTGNPTFRHFGYNSSTTGFAVYGSSLKIQYMAIGRWK